MALTKDLPRHYCPECRGRGRVPKDRYEAPVVAEEFGIMVECERCKGTGRLSPKQKAKSPAYQSKGSKRKTIDAPFIQDALRKKYGKSPWVYFSELRNLPTFDATRTIDGYAVHTGDRNSFLAFEIKIDRADFQRDTDSGKWKDWSTLSTEFWFVTPPGLLDEPDTFLPVGCGLMECDKFGNLRKVSYPSVHPFDSVPSTLVRVLCKRVEDMK